MTHFSAGKSRRLAVRIRGDLVVRPPGPHESAFVLKDPVTLKHFQLLPEEFAILRWLDGKRSAMDLKRDFEATFAPARLSLPRLQLLLAQFARDGLVTNDTPGIGSQLLAKCHEQTAEQWREKWSNPLAVRFRGINPERLLTWMHGRLGWLFHPVWIVACIGLIFSALLCIVMHITRFVHQWDELSAIQQPQNVLWLMLTLSVIKVIHELAHGLACKHFGGECHEMGIMFLVFAPCLYCNVSDAWMIPRRSHRVAVAAAGMFVEAVLAAACFWIWWFSQPGLIHLLCMNVMIVCSVGTILFNANPLLRYDGYFMLSDCFHQPNLWQVSQELIKSKIQLLCLGWKSTMAHPKHWNDASLITYGFASWSYRLVVLVSIVLLIYRSLREWHFDNLATVFLWAMIGATTIAPAQRTIQTLRKPLRQRIHKSRLMLTLGVIGIAFVTAFSIPLPTYVSAPAIYRMAQSEPIYVTVPGRLEFTSQIGTVVRKGDVIARLTSVDTERQVAQLRGHRNQLSAELEQLEAYQGADVFVSNKIPAMREQLKGIEAELERVELNAKQLTLTAGRDGVVLAPRERHANADVHAVSLTAWQGIPLHPSNMGAWLDRGTLICEVGDPKDLEAMLYMTAADAALVAPGQVVQASAALASGRRMRGQVVEVSNGPIADIPQDLFTRHEVAYRADASGKLISEQPLYEVRIEIEATSEIVSQHEYGRARIRVNSRTLAQRIVAFLRETFAAGSR